ncbi:MAG: hypothetical protein PHZ11_01000 [Desulfitobacteriaceae bacterium]|nr:hypothetical protein [Desulfitobacteriaceae bacterium]MDD4345471.1 hypothetical protein [Desulfitobacteriaceae bacterium]MDD4400681.1 hypothetical protein [Desulfitobacteriaceae bacterium]
MARPASNSSKRRYVTYIGTLGTTHLHLRNPYVIAFWSFVFPGLGHIMLEKYLMGYLLFLWEVFINLKAHINLAILYSFTGRFQTAKDVLDINWVLLYFPTYLFAVWNSYRLTIDLNHQYKLAVREDADIEIFNINTIEINYLDKKIPWHTAIWSALMPGLGQLLCHRIPAGIFLAMWFLTIAYLSKLPPAFHYTFLGQFNFAKSIIDPQWFLNIPSIYFGSIYGAYTSTATDNRIFDWEQAKFLKKNYQNVNFKLPFAKIAGRDERMYIVSTFEHSNYLELAITAIQMKGIAKDNILAIPLDKRGEQKQLFDTLHSSDGLSLFDLPMILATMFCIFGSIYGFILTWGPVIWGIIALFTGFALGLIIKLISTKKYTNRQKKQKATEVILIIECQENQLESVKDTLWNHNALGVSKLSLDN